MRIYAGVSPLALKGMTMLFGQRDIYAKPTGDRFLVVTR